jgi:hypothetical protein
MSVDEDPRLRVVSFMGWCLLMVQEAERALARAVETVLDHPDLWLLEQSEFERKQTLGDFLKKLKRRVKVEPALKDGLYHFLKMRNTFIHDVAEVPGWDLASEQGRKIAMEFLVELAVASLAVTALFITTFHVGAKIDLGEDFSERAEESKRQIIEILEKQFGPLARKILAARYRPPRLVHSAKR